MTSTNYNSSRGTIASEQNKMPGIGFNNSAWNGGSSSNIWGQGPIGSGVRAGDASRSLARNGDSRGAELESLSNSKEISGSSSLLDSSESEGWGRRNSVQWSNMANSSLSANGPAASRNGHGSTSPVRSRTNQHTRSNSPFPSSALPAIGTTGSGKSAQTQSHLDPTSQTFNSSGLFNTSLQMKGGSGMRHSGDEASNLNSIHVGSNMTTNGTNSYSGYASSAASRSGSLPPSRHGNEQVAPQFGEIGSIFHQSKSDLFAHRPNQPSHSSNYSMSGANRTPAQNWDSPNDLSSALSRVDLGRDGGDTFTNHWDQSYQLTSPGALNGATNGLNYQRNGSVSYDQDNRIPLQLQQQYNQYRLNQNDAVSQSPSGSDTRRGYDSPLYQQSTPPLIEHHRAPSNASSRSNFAAQNYVNPIAVERRLRNLQQQERYPGMQQTPGMANAATTYGQNGQSFYPYGTGNLTPQALARMNMNQPYFPQNVQAINAFQANGMATTHRAPPRGPAIDTANESSFRSALMEEFRSSKGNRKYELKDIYNHIVEFSGDQHGSRFIQQKLETANSDEKAQLFSEIFPNAWQLMTDVFGNYVVQKFFEHGNQTQKRQLADKMKGHIAELSVQMYGCRVVQKAFEHVLVDQQAALVKEIEPKILEIIKDQNGNHVVQKAIQRISPEHIAFINKAVSGNVSTLASHAYGCRVIQRMLETFVGQQTQYNVIDELHVCAQVLIVDQYGNYVIQNVMDHGREADRLKLVELTIKNVLVYSKHKYASNVVEHCLRNGTEEQRQRMIDIIRSVDERGELRMNQLVRDQFGNYVIQTIMKILKGEELRSFVFQIREVLARVRQYAYGKHIAQIEKAVDEKIVELNATLPPQQLSVDHSTTTTPPPLVNDDQSPQSTSQPSTTNNSTLDGPVGSSDASTVKISDQSTVAEETGIEQC